MKCLITMLCVILSIGMVAQETQLKALEVENLSASSRLEFQLYPVYHYLIENYKPISKKKSLPPNGRGDCGFTQTFEEGITYTKRNCGDAEIPTGELLTITHPDRTAITKWVEDLNNLLYQVNNNMWNFEQTTYRPVGGIPGAFFEIYRERDQTKVLVMTGC